MIHNDNLSTEPRIISPAPVSPQEETLEHAGDPAGVVTNKEAGRLIKTLGVGKKTAELLLLELQGKFAVGGAQISGRVWLLSSSDVVNALLCLKVR